MAQLVEMVADKYKNDSKEKNDDGAIQIKTKKRRRHIALLFLTIDDLPHEHLWKEWLKSGSDEYYCLENKKNEEDATEKAASTKNATATTANAAGEDFDNTATETLPTNNDEATSLSNNNHHHVKENNENDNVIVSILCHAKYPERITSAWLRQRHLLKLRQQRRSSSHDDGDNNSSRNSSNNGNTTTYRTNNATNFHSRRPEWGSVEITRAMIDLLEEGLRIGDCCKEEENDTVGGGAGSGVGGNGASNIQGSYCRYLATPGDAPSENSATSDKTANDNDDDTKPSSTSTIHTENDSIPPVDRFVFVSESCLPVATLKEMELALFGPKKSTATAAPTPNADETPQSKNSTPTTSDNSNNQQQSSKPPSNATTEALYNKSWINARSTPNNGYARQLQWDAIRPADIPPNYIWKADQWMVLTRTHGRAIATLSSNYLAGYPPLWTTMKNVRASDEMYFPTAAAILGILHRPPGRKEVDDDTTTNIIQQQRNNNKESLAGKQVRRRKITYCDWSVGAKNPASFTTVEEWRDVVKKARGEGCLLARKFVVRKKKNNTNGGGGGGGREKKAIAEITVQDWKSAIVKQK
eukprot:CAMPEP_0183767812 /NCGR_PEP_ID=MMETSP0739-20130205/12408_1 /TAXON_ID=385413 /ORGANISM="Thalassiosira miniscula, Strain CCMP1093" /LENGTH=583 /DNA_ID=CAMNT_0026006753 /DNA_START=12 /DNA_END=1763 /DNA_ORIENTATION=+